MRPPSPVLAGALALAAVIGFSPQLAAAEPATLTIVHVNDLDRMQEENGSGGVARFAAVVERMRGERRHVLVTNGGDAISPSLMSGFDKGAHMIDLLNKVGVDAMVVGNHEFDFGPEVAKERIAEAEFLFLSNNAIEEDGSLLDGVTEHLLVDVGPYQVGVFGLTTAGTAVKSSPGPVTFRDPLEVAVEQDAELRAAGADLVIALAHTDVGEDQELLRKSPVDVILSGDDHDVRIQFDGIRALVESGSQAEFVTIVEITMEAVEEDGKTEFSWQPSFEIINTVHVAPDPEMEAEVETYLDQMSEELGVEIGRTEIELDTRRTTVRTRETGFANLIADAIRDATDADVAITNGGGIRADRVYPAGTVLTRADVLSELPFGNKTVVIEVTGADIVAALEHGVGAIEEGAGRYPHVSGLSFEFDGSRPAGERVSAVMVAEQPIEIGGTYRLATNDFMGRGGDGYAMFVDRPQIVDANAGELMATQVIRHLENAGTIAPVAEGRVTRLD